MKTRSCYTFLAGVAVLSMLLQATGCVPMIVAGAVAGAGVAYDRRTTGTVIDDQGIELKLTQYLYAHPELSTRSHINITSFNHIVLLTGEVHSQEVADQIEQQAGVTPKVRRVYNELTVGETSSLQSRSNDSWITTKVKGSILKNGAMDPLRIKVVTERGTVYLMGLVTQQESDNAAEMARTISGVKQVVRLFEYIEPQE